MYWIDNKLAVNSVKMIKKKAIIIQLLWNTCELVNKFTIYSQMIVQKIVQILFTYAQYRHLKHNEEKNFSTITYWSELT